jgi:hypothetical protein
MYNDDKTTPDYKSFAAFVTATILIHLACSLDQLVAVVVFSHPKHPAILSRDFKVQHHTIQNEFIILDLQ